MNRTVYIYVLDTMADWEIGFLTAELNSGRYFKKDADTLQVVTVGLEKRPITTMGGLKVMPDVTLNACEIKPTDLLILPGGNTWLESIHEPMIACVKACMAQNTMIGAICGATMALAQNGILDAVKHTSNDLGYLKMVCPSYQGEAYYQTESAVTDGNLTTASGIAPLEFTYNILKVLEVMRPETLEAWYNLYKTQNPMAFYELMKSCQ